MVRQDRAPHRAWPCSGLVVVVALSACLTPTSPPDRFAGIVGATVLPDGAIVVLPPEAADGSAEDPGDAGSTPGDDDGGEAPDSAVQEGPPPAGCDLRGRWLVSDHTVLVSMGIHVANLIWRYYELEQAGTRLTVKRGLLCGRTSIPVDALGANGDQTGQFPALLVRVRDDGRIGTIRQSGAGCTISFEKRYATTGATVPYYLDPAQKLPTLSEKADQGRPGWEDWDGDGKPGVAIKVSGFANGTLHTAERSFTAWSGSVSANPSNFRLANPIGFQRSTLLIEGSELLDSAASVDPDASKQFVRFVKLRDSQAAATDETALCAQIRALAPELAPDANE